MRKEHGPSRLPVQDFLHEIDHEGIKILRLPEAKADPYDISAQGYSFPSAHSSNSSGMFVAMAACLRKRWATALAILLPLLTGISRVVLGAHYPTDVLGGWLLGVLIVLIVPALQKRVKNTLVLYGILLLVNIPGFFYCKSADYFTGAGLLIGFMGGTLLEESCVHFENTRKPLWTVIRLLGGLAVYFVLNKLLKLPFSEEFLSNGTTASLLVRCARYGVIAFVDFGVYPMLFRLENGRAMKKTDKAEG
jgi:hypothetical protein